MSLISSLGFRPRLASSYDLNCACGQQLTFSSLVPKQSPNWMDILRHVHKLEVHQTEKVIVEWVVTSLTGETMYGRADAGRVTSRLGKRGYQIFLTADDLNAPLPPLELQEELTKLCEIKDPSLLTVLLYILMHNDVVLIEDTLQRRGIPDDIPDFEGSAKGKHW